MRSVQTALLRACQARSALLSAATTSAAGCTAVNGLHTFSGVDRNGKENQAASQQLPSLASMLTSNSKQFNFSGLGLPQHIAQMASAPQPSGETTSWSSLREQTGMEKKSSLGPAMYALILTFGFGWLLQDFTAYPARIMAMTGLVFFILYSRRQ